MGLCTVARFDFPWQAHLARGQLETAGIEAYIADEHTITMDWLYSQALGGVRLQVAKHDLSAARQVLAKISDESSLATDIDPEEQTTLETDEPLGSITEPITKTYCQACGSAALLPHVQGRRPAFLVFLIAGFPLWPFKRRWRCEDCGSEQAF